MNNEHAQSYYAATAHHLTPFPALTEDLFADV
jgi:hypothetical protein